MIVGSSGMTVAPTEGGDGPAVGQPFYLPKGQIEFQKVVPSEVAFSVSSVTALRRRQSCAGPVVILRELVSGQ